MAKNGGGGNTNELIMQQKMNIDDVLQKRVREYGEKSKGPFIVCIRAISKPLQSMKITKFLHNTYKSNLITRQINEFKMNVIFSPENDKNNEKINAARNEANNFPTTAWNKTCRIYIPERLVETIGCISWSSEEGIDEILSVGLGKFRNVSMPSVKILHAARFEKIIDEAGEQRREATNTVRVTFDGLLLPEFLNVDGLLIPVREFKRKQMFCELCLKYNHTKSHCNNKPHKTETNEKKCLHCKVDDHQTGEKNCPRRKILENRDKGKVKEIQKMTYAQMLKEFDPNASINNSNEDTHVHLNLGKRIERKRYQQQGTSSKKETPIKKRRVENVASDDESWADEMENVPPPGFKNTKNIDDDLNITNDITKMIKNFIMDLNLPPFITNLILKVSIPFIDKFINQLTNSFMAKMAQFGNE